MRSYLNWVEKLFDQLIHQRNSACSSNYFNWLNIWLRNSCPLDCQSQILANFFKNGWFFNNLPFNIHVQINTVEKALNINGCLFVCWKIFLQIWAFVNQFDPSLFVWSYVKGVFFFEGISDVVSKDFIDLKPSKVRHRNMRKHSHTLDVLLSDRIKSSKKLDDRYLQDVASKVEKSNIDRVRIIAGNCKVNSSSWIFIDKTQSVQISYCCSIDQGQPRSEAPVSRYCQHCVFDVRACLCWAIFFDIFQDHSDQLLKGNPIFSFFKVIGPVLKAITCEGSLCIKWFYQFVQVEIRRFGLFLSFGERIVLEMANSV